MRADAMSISPKQVVPHLNLLDQDDVLPVLHRWRSNGMRAALVTLVSVEGGAPRQPGAQMAVAEDGSYVGYLSGGCLEQAVALEARSVIACGQNRLVRYGKGSPYFDIRLPCGSGLDLYFDQALDIDVIEAMSAMRARRCSFAMTTRLSSGASTAEALAEDAIPLSHRSDDAFTRVYAAPLRLALIGNGPALTGIATLARATGVDTLVWSSDEATQSQLAQLGVTARSAPAELVGMIGELDFTTATVLVFHDHDAEPDILERLLQRPCFYIGVLGNRAVHRARLDALREMGVDPQLFGRIHAPVGSIPNAKSKTTFAFGVLTEMLAEAKASNIIA